VEFLVLLLFFGLSTGVVAKIRGNSFLLWALIGFCLPMIGTVLALLHRSERREPKRRCEECGNVVALHDQVCMRCGRDLTFPEPVEAAGAPETRW
jgi:hypothetical protein